jgi:hypothetical protein
MSIAESRAVSFHATTAPYEIRTRRARQRKDEMQTQPNTATAAPSPPRTERRAPAAAPASYREITRGEWAVQTFTTDHWISVQELPRAYPM